MPYAYMIRAKKVFIDYNEPADDDEVSVKDKLKSA